VDETHDRLKRDILQLAIRFDSSFGNVRTAHMRQASYELNLLNSLRVERRGRFEFGASLRAKFVLSKISEKLHLFSAGYVACTNQLRLSVNFSITLCWLSFYFLQKKFMQ